MIGLVNGTLAMPGSVGLGLQSKSSPDQPSPTPRPNLGRPNAINNVRRSNTRQLAQQKHIVQYSHNIPV